MIRESLSGGSPNMLVAATIGSGWTFQRRRTAGGISYGPGATKAGTAPGWVRITRQGNTLTGYTSTDGTNWTVFNSDTIAMSSTVYVGLAVTAHSPTGQATAVFTNVTARSLSQTSNPPPAVSISGPSNGATYTAPANMTITATASDGNGGSVSRVDFYNGSTLLGSDSSSPYSYNWTGVGAGTYALTAVAYDNGGASTQSAAVSVTVSGVVSTPTTVVFNPSPDHATLVTSYSIALRRNGDPVTAAPVATKSLGKPSPSNNEISASISDIVDPLPSGSYYAVVTANGSGGSATSSPSAAFSK
jgi:hypothetical protein